MRSIQPLTRARLLHMQESATRSAIELGDRGPFDEVIDLTTCLLLLHDVYDALEACGTPQVDVPAQHAVLTTSRQLLEATIGRPFPAKGLAALFEDLSKKLAALTGKIPP